MVAEFGCSINSNGFLEREGELYCVCMGGDATGGDMAELSSTTSPISLCILYSLFHKLTTGQDTIFIDQIGKISLKGKRQERERGVN